MSYFTLFLIVSAVGFVLTFFSWSKIVVSKAKVVVGGKRILKVGRIVFFTGILLAIFITLFILVFFTPSGWGSLGLMVAALIFILCLPLLILSVQMIVLAKRPPIGEQHISLATYKSSVINLFAIIGPLLASTCLFVGTANKIDNNAKYVEHMKRFISFQTYTDVVKVDTTSTYRSKVIEELGNNNPFEKINANKDTIKYTELNRYNQDKEKYGHYIYYLNEQPYTGIAINNSKKQQYHLNFYQGLQHGLDTTLLNPNPSKKEYKILNYHLANIIEETLYTEYGVDGKHFAMTKSPCNGFTLSKNGLSVSTENGIKLKEYQYKNNVPNGPFKVYVHSQKSIHQQGNYLQGYPHGTINIYYATGETYQEQHYNKGKKTGLWKVYNKEGELVHKEQY